MPQADPRELLVKIAEILERLDILYMVTGGMAVLVWGRPRFTADIDIVVEIKEKHINVLSQALMALGKAGYVSKEAMQEAISRKGEFNFIDGETGVKVDFWVLNDDPFAKSQIKRRIIKEVDNQKIYFVSPENLILSKLEWYQQSQSSRHLEDVESILKISGDKLDKAYLKQWAERLGFLETLNKILYHVSDGRQKHDIASKDKNFINKNHQ